MGEYIAMQYDIKSIVKKYNDDPTRLMDILIDVQSSLGYLSDSSIEKIAKTLDIPKVDVVQTVSFYHFFAREPRGKYTVYLNDSVVAGFYGRENVRKAFEEAAGIKFGEVTADGLIGLFNTACIGMNDQEPAAIINEKIFTKLTPAKAKTLISGMRAGKSVAQLIQETLESNAKPSLENSMVENNIIKRGTVIFADYTPGEALKKVLNLSSLEVINIMKNAALRGRGGAGFPTGMKWDVARKVQSNTKYIFCNADEGEPGTFKDRVILTTMPKLVFEGMALAAYAVGAQEGILYLRNEYLYMREYLENILKEMRLDDLLGDSICGKEGFDFDIRIQFGAGAYVCGEESALIESAEGKRGEPRDRPPFPVEQGYLQKPTVVNNVETFGSVVRIIQNGAAWYNKMGTEQSKGTKVLSISGDCLKPGIYEIEWGFSVNDILKMAEAENVQAVQVGGPSGTCIASNEFDRILAYEDLATGGSLIIIGKNRDLLKDVVLNFGRFFEDESCGSCVPCRALTVICVKIMEWVIAGKARKTDLDAMVSWTDIMKKNRCGLGQTAMNPIISTIKNFRELYDKKIKAGDDRFNPVFDLKAAVADYESIVGEFK